MMLSAAATRVDEVYDPPNDMEFGVWTASMGRVTNNPDGWDRFYIAIRRADGMVIYMENFKSLLHSQVQQAAQEAGLVVRESLRTRTLPRRTPKRARAPLCAVKDDTFSSHASNPYPIRIPTTLTLPLLSTQGGSMDNIRNYLTPCGAPPWTFKGDSQPYVTPMTKKSLPLGNSSAGRSWEKKFENMRGRDSIGFELSTDELENLLFPQAVEDKFVQLGVGAWDERHPMEAKLAGKVRFYLILFPPPPSLISYIMCDMRISYI